MSTIVMVIALLIAVSATYNAYLLRGGKMAWSEILIVLGMVSLIFSLVLGRFLADWLIFQNLTLTDGLFVLGFLFLLAATFKLRSAIK